MTFTGKQKTFDFTQLNSGTPEEVFPLLCPEREKDWLDGWDYQMIHSHSGLAEKNCVFTTAHHGETNTVWHITQHDPTKFKIEFLRVTPNENVVRINIELFPKGSKQTTANIQYQYTALNERQNLFIENELETEFLKSMHWWEKALNHYLETGEKLLKDEAN